MYAASESARNKKTNLPLNLKHTMCKNEKVALIQLYRRLERAEAKATVRMGSAPCVPHACNAVFSCSVVQKHAHPLVFSVDIFVFGRPRVCGWAIQEKQKISALILLGKELNISMYYEPPPKTQVQCFQ